MKIPEESTILISCGRGLVPYLKSEIETLGYETTTERMTDVEIVGTMWDAMLLNIHLRTAYCVFFKLTGFECATPDQLYANVKSIPWEDLIAPSQYVSVSSRVDTPSIDNTMFASLKVKDAIVDRIKSVTGKRPDSGPDRHRVVVQLYWKNNEAIIYMNTSGVKISDRGYRKLPHSAPLRESRAAAVIQATGYDGSCPLVNPMCGSGTLAIEAALIAMKRAPGLLRSNYCFQHLKSFDEEAYEGIRRDAKSRQAKNKELAHPIIATDIDPNAVRAAQINARTAGVDHLIRFATCDFAQTEIPPAPGILVVNPEYGMRLGEVKELEGTYSRLGDFFKQACTGYTAYVFTGNLDLAKKIGLKASRRMEFWNAKIECRLLKYEMYSGTRRED